MKDHAVERSSDVRTKISLGFNIISVHPINQKEVPLLITGLGQAVPDNAVFNYLQRFGLKNVNDTSERLRATGGLWKDQENGDRRIIVDISQQIMPMGIWHLPSNMGPKSQGHIPRECKNLWSLSQRPDLVPRSWVHQQM